MENVHSNFTIHTLKSCGKTANVVSIKNDLQSITCYCYSLVFLNLSPYFSLRQ